MCSRKSPKKLMTMMNDFLHTLGIMLVLAAGVIAIELGIIAVKALMIRSQRSQLEIMSNNIATLAKERSDLKVLAYSVKCENVTHTETIKRLQSENDELREKNKKLMDGIPVGPEGLRFECVNH